jgi:hypothetical protein
MSDFKVMDDLLRCFAGNGQSPDFFGCRYECVPHQTALRYKINGLTNFR